MANEQNLRPSEYKLSQEEATKGGIASGEARRRKRNIRLALEALLEKEYKCKDGKTLTGAEQQSLRANRLDEYVMRSNVIRDTAM